ncbi:ATP-dependent DNA helicase [Fulvivirga lutea]|uniref:AAA family ATPase n=1 Tax=Fulvivirga lutea TaxID=2810512 RepID=A0A974WKV8_9BACT|nr:AAA family ATPase [Fulvivirga lutea]QSE99082.1 AAA family ATPase [Fulvivirga lutea]
MPKPSEILKQKFPFEPTSDQARVFEAIDTLIDLKDALVIKGYAGTGKTTLISTLVQVLPLFNYKYVLLAPTGRAAKVMASYSGRMAFTIHKRIYKQANKDASGPVFKRQKNYSKKTIFIIDESSMINEDVGFGKKGLLTDLMEYVFSEPTNKLILVGDNAQLPPVGQIDSPALDINVLTSDYKLDVVEVLLTEVMRQELESGILYNATNLRQELANKAPKVGIDISFSDIFKMTGQKLEDGIRYAYDNEGVENTAILCRSNKNANAYNQYIRNRIFFYDSEIEAGEYLMIVRNNYLFGPEEIGGGFLANGDFVEVMKIVSFEEMHGFRFATLELRLTDYPDLRAFEAKVILDTLHSETPALIQEQNEALYQSVALDYADLKQKDKKEAMKTDPYLNALQIKFAYAITCHKAQGGQWPLVFVDQGYLKEETVDHDFIRWLYTAITRATKQLFLVNFNRQFFVKSYQKS